MKLMTKKNCPTSSILADYIRDNSPNLVDVMDINQYDYVVKGLKDFEEVPCLVLDNETCITDVPTIKEEIDKHAAKYLQ